MRSQQFRLTLTLMATVLIGLLFCRFTATQPTLYIALYQENGSQFTVNTSRLKRTHQDKFSAPFWNEVKKLKKNDLIIISADPEKLREAQIIAFGKMLGLTKMVGLEFLFPLYDLDSVFDYILQIFQNLTLMDGSKTTVYPVNTDGGDLKN